jgi:type VI secretion system protein ImpL
LAQAQSFADAPSNLSEGIAAEEILRSKINDVKESTPKFVKLLEVLNQDSVGVSFVELRSLLASTSFWLLSQVESMLRSLNPYAVHDLTFAWWQGKQGAAFLGYSSKDTEDLKVYLSLQRQLMQTMAIDFAKPLVGFLMSDVMLDASGDKVLLNKWHRIVDQMEAFAKKQPGNSVTVLEDFILKTLNSYDLKNCFDLISLSDIRQESGDYFIETVRSLKRAVIARGEVLKRRQGIQNYTKLATFYNQNLKNKFPFVSSNVSLTTPEVDPESIRDFFRLYDEAGGSAKAIFDQIYQLGSSTLPALRFLQNMEAVKKFFQTYLSGNGDNDLPTFTFDIDFRANRQSESGGDLIVDWTIKPHPDVTIDKNDKSHVGRWSYGNPVEIGFRWPDGDSIPAKPAKDPLQPVLDVDERKATFKYTGRWALLWMLKIHGASKGDYAPLKDPNSFMLKFIIPTGAEDKAVVYNSITLMAPSSNPKAPGKVISVPLFPVLAPELDSSVMNYAEQAVLTEGVVTPLEYMELPSASLAVPDQKVTETVDTPAPEAAAAVTATPPDADQTSPAPSPAPQEAVPASSQPAPLRSKGGFLCYEGVCILFVFQIPGFVVFRGLRYSCISYTLRSLPLKRLPAF